MSADNTVFLRLEGPLQAWGLNSQFVIRETGDAPTKSGVLGLICCAMGKDREQARNVLGRLNDLFMGVRIDRPGTRWHDYHTVGARTGLRTAEGELKTGAKGTLITRRYYLADASFLVALHGDPGIIQEVAAALAEPRWTLYLGRKSCPPAVPVFPATDPPTGGFPDLPSALQSVPWRPRLVDVDGDDPGPLTALIEWRSAAGEAMPADVELWQDEPVSFLPPVHRPRPVRRATITPPIGDPVQTPCPRPEHPRANYTNSRYQKIRDERLAMDHGLCVFCKQPATTVQHVTYRHAGGGERIEELRAMCRLCHDAVTMLEYGLNLGMDRIDPCEPRWRDEILRTRDEIRRWRSEEGRRRALRQAPERLRREVLEEDEG